MISLISNACSSLQKLAGYLPFCKQLQEVASLSSRKNNRLRNVKCLHAIQVASFCGLTDNLLIYNAKSLHADTLSLKGERGYPLKDIPISHWFGQKTKKARA